MEQLKAMEYESRKASSDVLKPRNIYIYIYIYTHTHTHTYNNNIANKNGKCSHTQMNCTTTAHMGAGLTHFAAEARLHFLMVG
jgi:hypothetical protein